MPRFSGSWLVIWLPMAPLVLLMATSCQAEPPSPSEVAPPHSSPEAIADGPVTGRIAGAPFTAHDARYVVDQRPGREKIDLKLSAATAAEACAPRLPVDAPSVWIRFNNTVSLRPGRWQRTTREPTTWSVHYQNKRGDHWIGNSDGAALLVIRAVRPSFLLEGDLSVCWADGQNSCVAGAFTARYCPDPLDPGIRDLGPPVGARGLGDRGLGNRGLGDHELGDGGLEGGQ